MQESTRWITIESTILVTRASILYIAGGVPGTRYNSEVPVPGTWYWAEHQVTNSGNRVRYPGRYQPSRGNFAESEDFAIFMSY